VVLANSKKKLPEFSVAICRPDRLKHSRFVSVSTLPQPLFAMPKLLIGISTVLMALSLLLGFLNTNKVKGLRNEIVTNISQREQAEVSRRASEKKLKAREADFTAATNKATAAEEKASSAEAGLTKARATSLSTTKSRLSQTGSAGGGAGGGGGASCGFKEITHKLYQHNLNTAVMENMLC
jgi:hypothetical protein